MLNFLLNWFLISFVTAIVSSATNSCITPNKEVAECISLISCPKLREVFFNPTVSDFIEKSICGGTLGRPKICCGTHSNFTTTTKIVQQNVKFKNEKNCGYQHSDDYNPEVQGPVISEHPWLALIEYKDNDRVVPQARGNYLCSGSLLNNKYVLTAAYCVVNTSIKPTTVRLGDYHIFNLTDCVKDMGIVECSEVQEFGIEDIVPHPQYSGESNHANNIALIRLAGTVIYTDYVRPVCLPFTETKTAKINDTLVTSGWGRRDIRKKEVSLTYISFEDCKNAYSHYHIAMPNIDGQESTICATSTGWSYTCYGNEGGPVMFHNSRWYQQAIISHGCGRILPEVYVKVNYYLDWIGQNVKP